MQRGLQHMQAGEFIEAGRAFERAAQQMPDLADAHCFRADALMRAGKLEPALSSAERAVRLRPGWGEAWMLRGNIEALLERFAEAEATFRRAIDLMGSHPGLHANLAHVLADQGRLEEALGEYDRALEQKDAVDIRAKRALLLYRLGRRTESEQAWNEVLERDPRSLEAMEQLLQLYMGQRRYDDIESLCTRAAAIAPEAAMFRLGRGVALWGQGRYDEALEHYRQASRLAFSTDKSMHYEANMNEAVGLLKLGRWREGWARYRWRVDREALRERYPHLAAEPADIASAPTPLRIRVHAEQGLGDELFFLRFAPLLRARGHRLSYRSHIKLIALLRARTELFDGIGREDEEDPLPCDIELQSSDLALASGKDFAPALPLGVEQERRGAIAARLQAFGPPPYVGVTWRAGLTPQEQQEWQGIAIWVKHVPVENLARVLRPIRASVVILQRKPDPEEKAAFVRELDRDVLDLSGVNEDLRDALALLSLLDEYVGVSNTNMHLLAGIAGKRARVLVQKPAEWRWGMSGVVSPWFPDFHLYRQAGDRSWNQALDCLTGDLVALHNKR
jgi:tetratricopeptide (TPR) repeat protein